jgi:DNA-directed RNA polymerase III subunit RPC6
MSNAHLKSEPMDTSLVDLESEILQLCRQYPQGVSNKIVENSFQHVTSQQRLSAINRLLLTNQIDLLRPSNEPKTFLYRLRDTNHTSRSSMTIENGLTDQMERTVYQIVKENGNLGIGMHDIRFRTQLSQTVLNKILKILESKKLIKAVKSVHAKKKKVKDYFHDQKVSMKYSK